MARLWSRTRVLPRGHTRQSQWCTQVDAVGRAKERHARGEALLGRWEGGGTPWADLIAEELGQECPQTPLRSQCKQISQWSAGSTTTELVVL
jgi:hypothetical protein